MAKVNTAQDGEHSPNLRYFEPLYLWQIKPWQQFVAQYRGSHLPHALIAQGMAGVAKRTFVWRMVGFLLCDDKAYDEACGQCESCRWLMADTHPNLHVLPKEDGSIKIDDIRELQDFIHTKSDHARIIVLDYADNMTLAAANALLKSLEESGEGVYWLLISDEPSRLLPTIQSRVQSLPLLPIDENLACQYLMDKGFDKKQAHHLLQLSDFAPLIAEQLPQCAWYDKRKAWVQTLTALQTGKRSVTQASEYWQGVLTLKEFMELSRRMVLDVWRVSLGLDSLHTDIEIKALLQSLIISEQSLTNILSTLNDVNQSIQQNVQDKLAFDKILLVMSQS